MPYDNHGNNKTSNDFRNLLMGAALGVASLVAIGTYAVADTVPEGHVGLQRAKFTGKYASTLLSQGLSFNPFTTVLDLRAQQFPVEVKDLRPKDKDGTLFEDMDLTVFVRIKTENPEEVITFLRKVGDTTKTNSDSILLGANSVAKEARSAIPRAVREFSSTSLLDDRSKMENRAKQEVQSALNEKYPNVFEIIDVNAYGITYNPMVESSIQAASAKEAQKKVMEIEMAQTAQRKELMLRQFGTLKEVSSATGVSVDQILLSQQIAAMGDGARYQMRGEPGKLAKPEVVVTPGQR